MPPRICSMFRSGPRVSSCARATSRRRSSKGQEHIKTFAMRAAVLSARRIDTCTAIASQRNAVPTNSSRVTHSPDYRYTERPDRFPGRYELTGLQTLGSRTTKVVLHSFDELFKCGLANRILMLTNLVGQFQNEGLAMAVAGSGSKSRNDQVSFPRGCRGRPEELHC